MVFMVWSLSWVMMLMISYMVWWGCFIAVTMVGLMKLKFYNNPVYTMAVYFFVQEISGVFFVLSFSTSTQMMMIMFKGGFAPFHFWMTSVVSMSKGQAFLWMLTWQKMPYVFVSMHFMTWSTVLVILLGMSVPLIQGVFVSSFKMVLFYLLSSSGGSPLVYGYYSPILMLLIIPFYMHLMCSMMGVVSNYGGMYLGLESVFVMMSMPGSLPFFFKIGMMSCLVSGGGFFLVVILALFVLNITITINVMVNFNYKFSPGNKHFMFLFISYMIVPYF